MPIAPTSSDASGLTRRRFAQLLGRLSALAVIEPQIMVRALASNKRRLGWLAYRNPRAEGGHPTAIDPVDLSYRGRFGFHSSLQKNVPFTTHPKFDPATGEGYGFGIR